MREQGRDAEPDQPLDGGVERERPAPVRELQQEIAPGLRDRQPAELRQAESPRGGRGRSRRRGRPRRGCAARRSRPGARRRPPPSSRPSSGSPPARAGWRRAPRSPPRPHPARAPSSRQASALRRRSPGARACADRSRRNHSGPSVSATACKMSPSAVRDPLTILHVSQPTDGGVGKYVEEAVADQARRGWRVIVAAPSHDGLAERVEAAGAKHVEWTASRAPGPGSLWTRWHVRPDRRARAAGARPPALVQGRARRPARDPRARPTIFQPHAWSFEAVRGAVRAGAVALGAIRGALGDRDRLRQRGRAAEGRAARHRGELARDPERRRPRGVAGGRRRGASAARERLGPRRAADGRSASGGSRARKVRMSCSRPGRRSSKPCRERAARARRGRPRRGVASKRAGPGVHLVGERDDVADWLAAADVVVLPSRWEGMSLGLLEAMASRAQRRRDATSAAREEAIGDEAGAVVPPGDAAALATQSSSACGIRHGRPRRAAPPASAPSMP